MNPRSQLFFVRGALCLLVVSLSGLVLLHGADDKPAPNKDGKPKANEKHTPQAWTLEEARSQLRLQPRDSYLQYVALQLARRENKLPEVAGEIDYLVARNNGWRRNERAERVDLFSIFTGALAVQESLQLDAMRGDRPGRFQGVEPKEIDDKNQLPIEKRRKELVAVAGLKGPEAKSHPWKKMLGDKKPDVGKLAMCVPEDYYFIEFRSVGKMMDALDAADQWATHLFSQSNKEARSQQVGERMKKQLAIKTTPLLRSAYDLVVEEVAVTGSDLFLSEGTDVTLVFRYKQPELFKARMDGFLTEAEKEHTDARKASDKFLGVSYVHLATPDRALNVYSAYPADGVHVRSNSKVAFERILAAIAGKDAAGKEVHRLGDTAEFAYIRTLMPRGAAEEDGFIYLSDPFIRSLIGPARKLTERRRMLCYNDLRMIGHAALLYRTENGKSAQSLEELEKAGCLAGTFGAGNYACPDGGNYALSADGSFGTCSHHGHSHFLTPCAEIPVEKVLGEEADQYKAFVTEYNQYWRTYFDPIAIRLQATPERYRLETIVLPLIDNSIYTSLSHALGGKPESLDALPVPKRNIFSMALKVDKEGLLKESGLPRGLDFPGVNRGQIDGERIQEFWMKGIGNQVGLHAYDSVPMFDLNLPQLLGLMVGNFNRGPERLFNEEFVVAFLVASLNAPVYISIPVQDAKIVDGFLDALDEAIATTAREQVERGFLDFHMDFYKAPLKPDKTMRVASLAIGPVKWRMYWARIGNGLYIASKSFILDDLIAAEAAQAKDLKPANPAPPAHAMVRLRPRNWEQVLPDYRLAWAENNREACLNNQGPLANVARALAAPSPGGKTEPAPAAPDLSRDTTRMADQIHGVHFFCPEGGRYQLSPDGKSCQCDVHGSVTNPKQPLAPSEKSGSSKALAEFGGATITMTFMEDGLHTVVVIDRK